MTRLVDCKKLNQALPGLEFAPMHGELGERIYNEISQDAWKQWLGRSTMVINEYRLNPSEPQAQAVLLKEMDEFLFGSGGGEPPEFVDPE